MIGEIGGRTGFVNRNSFPCPSIGAPFPTMKIYRESSRCIMVKTTESTVKHHIWIWNKERFSWKCYRMDCYRWQKVHRCPASSFFFLTDARKAGSGFACAAIGEGFLDHNVDLEVCGIVVRSWAIKHIDMFWLCRTTKHILSVHHMISRKSY